MAQICCFDNLENLKDDIMKKNSKIKKLEKQSSNKQLNPLRTIQNFEKRGFLKLIPHKIFIEFNLDTSQFERTDEENQDHFERSSRNIKKPKKKRGLASIDDDMSKQPSKGKIYGRKFDGRFASKAVFKYHDLKRKRNAANNALENASGSSSSSGKNVIDRINIEESCMVKIPPVVQLDKGSIQKALMALKLPNETKKCVMTNEEEDAREQRPTKAFLLVSDSQPSYDSSSETLPELPKRTSNDCDKEFCRLGCLCQSLKVLPKNVEKKQHCGKVQCMFTCHCQHLTRSRASLFETLSPIMDSKFSSFSLDSIQLSPRMSLYPHFSSALSESLLDQGPVKQKNINKSDDCNKKGSVKSSDNQNETAADINVNNIGITTKRNRKSKVNLKNIFESECQKSPKPESNIRKNGYKRQRPLSNSTTVHVSPNPLDIQTLNKSADDCMEISSESESETKSDSCARTHIPYVKKVKKSEPKITSANKLLVDALKKGASNTCHMKKSNRKKTNLCYLVKKTLVKDGKSIEQILLMETWSNCSWHDHKSSLTNALFDLMFNRDGLPNGKRSFSWKAFRVDIFPVAKKGSIIPEKIKSTIDMNHLEHIRIEISLKNPLDQTKASPIVLSDSPVKNSPILSKFKSSLNNGKLPCIEKKSNESSSCLNVTKSQAILVEDDQEEVGITLSPKTPTTLLPKSPLLPIEPILRSIIDPSRSQVKKLVATSPSLILPKDGPNNNFAIKLPCAAGISGSCGFKFNMKKVSPPKPEQTSLIPNVNISRGILKLDKEFESLGTHPTANLNTNSSTNLSTDLNFNPNTNPSSNPNTNLNINPSTNLNTNLSTNLNTNPSTNLNTNPSTNLNTNPSTNLNTNPSTNPNTNPSTNPNTNPSTNPNTNPSTDSISSISTSNIIQLVQPVQSIPLISIINSLSSLRNFTNTTNRDVTLRVIKPSIPIVEEPNVKNKSGCNLLESLKKHEDPCKDHKTIKILSVKSLNQNTNPVEKTAKLAITNSSMTLPLSPSSPSSSSVIGVVSEKDHTVNIECSEIKDKRVDNETNKNVSEDQKNEMDDVLIIDKEPLMETDIPDLIKYNFSDEEHQSNLDNIPPNASNDTPQVSVSKATNSNGQMNVVHKSDQSECPTNLHPKKMIILPKKPSLQFGKFINRCETSSTNSFCRIFEPSLPSSSMKNVQSIPIKLIPQEPGGGPGIYKILLMEPAKTPMVKTMDNASNNSLALNCIEIVDSDDEDNSKKMKEHSGTIDDDDDDENDDDCHVTEGNNESKSSSEVNSSATTTTTATTTASTTATTVAAATITTSIASATSNDNDYEVINISNSNESILICNDDDEGDGDGDDDDGKSGGIDCSVKGDDGGGSINNGENEISIDDKQDDNNNDNNDHNNDNDDNNVDVDGDGNDAEKRVIQNIMDEIVDAVETNVSAVDSNRMQFEEIRFDEIRLTSGDRNKNIKTGTADKNGVESGSNGNNSLRKYYKMLYKEILLHGNLNVKSKRMSKMNILSEASDLIERIDSRKDELKDELNQEKQTQDELVKKLNQLKSQGEENEEQSDTTNGCD